MNDYLKDILFGACIILCILTITLSFAGMLSAAILVTIYGLMKPNGFASLGLKMPKSWLSNVGQALLYAIIIVLTVQWIITPSITYFTHEPLDLSVYRPLVGQVQLLLVYMTIGWVIGGITEELVFRGFILQRISHYLPGKWGVAIAVIISSTIFGYLHDYQGITGQIQTGIVGVLLALVVVLNKRKLALGMMTHGFVNTISMLMIYNGIYKV